jgi:hypothetical protein
VSKVEQELAIRLAWYVNRFGGIPEPDQRKLALIAMGIRRDEEAVQIRNLAEEIRQWIRSFE